jgi:hypothetical protein
MQYIFSGRTGEGASIKFDVKNPPLQLNVAGVEGQTCQLSLLLSGSIHLAVAITTAKPISDIATFRNQITTVCKSVYDAASFLNGISVQVELKSLLEVETNHCCPRQDLTGVSREPSYN